MLKEMREEIASGGAVAVAVGVAIAFAGLYFVQALVVYLIFPVVSMIFGSSNFELNSFTINGSEFRYGAVIEGAIVFILVIAAGAFALRWLKGGDHGSGRGAGS